MATDAENEELASETFVEDVAVQSDVKFEKKEKKPQPAYQIMAEKVVVSKAFGKTIEKKKDAALTAMSMVRQAWDESYRYYNHDQSKSDTFRSQPRSGSWWRRGDSYENLVFANASVMIPSIYAKNPDVYFETDQSEDKDFVQVLSKAINALFVRKDPYGVNLKPRMKKAALHCELTNMGIVKLDYVEKENSIAAAEEEMLRLVEEHKKAKSVKEVEEIEGKIQAIESQNEYREPSGFKLANVIPTNLVIDPYAENEDASDANFMFELVYIPTNYLNAKFTKKSKDGRVSLYKPTHKLKTDGAGNARDDALGMALEAIEEGSGETQDAHSTEERQSYIYEHMTKCWYYWDKITRRCYLFADNDWTWPVWVWNDPLRTTHFFPYYIFQFYPSTGGIASPGEVSFYLDQQDEINEINREIRKIRRIAFNVILYNSNKIKQEDAAILADYMRDGSGSNMLGVDVDQGMSIKDAVETITPPSFNFEPLFNKAPIYQSIDKIGSVSDAIRGQQFKTNTTEDAVQAYTSAAQLRLSNRTDSIEECVASLAWSMAEILVDRGDEEYIRGLVGDAEMEKWAVGVGIVELNSNYSVHVAAGSSEKPTSKFKKEEAVQVAQSIGQFAKAAPGATLKVVLKLLKNAFPELSINDEDWNAITQEIEAQLQRGVSTQGAAQGPTSGQPAPQDPMTGGAPGGAPVGGSQLEQLLMQLPPEIQQQVVQQVQAGVPAEEVLRPILEQLNGAGTA